MGRLYGDATPFPHDIDYLEMVRDAVHCAVRLLQAQASINEAKSAIAASERARLAERARLERIGEGVRKALLIFEQGERETRVVNRVRDASRAAIDEETAGIESLAASEQAARRADIEQARVAAHRALEEFLRVHAMPDSEVTVTLRAEENGHAGEATLLTPFGVRAVFRLELPPNDEWQRHRRMSELTPGCELQVPHEAGWISKRVELQKVKLDKLFVTEALVEPTSVRLDARKAFRSGPGYAIERSDSDGSVRVLDENGAAKDTHPIEDSDFATVDRLVATLRAELSRLAAHRGAMVSATFDDVPLADLEEPRAIAARLIAHLAPMTNEIERRSGGNDELILRRDVADGRREEKYVKKAELRELVCVLPIELRSPFEPLKLVPRSSLTPPPPAVIEREEISMELIEEEPEKKRFNTEPQGLPQLTEDSVANPLPLSVPRR